MKVHHRARRLALQGLCCLDAQGPRAMESVEQFIDDARDGLTITHTAKQLTSSAFADRDACDEILTRHSRNWDVRRLAVVDRNILRLGVHELRVGSAPYKVVISEALRLAKEFSTAESPRFINGVLDAVARELRDAEDHESEN